MTNDEMEELLADCPTLFHMAEHGSWPAIRERGLLSTSALLDLYGVTGDERESIEGRRRPSSVPLVHATLPRAVIRDQIPMDDARLSKCLPPHISPSDWYRILNRKVFFWLTRARLINLLTASTYRERAHDVIEIDSRSLVVAYHDRIWLCPMNSGNTKPIPHPRGEETFLRVGDYPYSAWRRKRKKGERVVELAVDYGVPDIYRHVVRVTEMKGEQQIRVIFRAR